MTRWSTLLLLGAGLAIAVPSTATPYGPDRSLAATAGEFGITALDDGALDAQTARALPVTRTSKSMTDQYSQTLLQDVGQDSRIALDNWWAQTGAALIVNNILQQ